ncbi:hypothetical protein [Xanthobacter autotrophicus]|uniref:hypothetical protein n=1 Tax=Xanthobacter autotrophicus TaxID=280 RepID=UPI003727F8F9
MAGKKTEKGEELDRFYDLVLAPQHWPRVLHDIARSVNAVGALIATERGSMTFVGHPVSPDLSEPIDDFVAGGWHLKDFRGRRAWPAAGVGRYVQIEHDVSSEEEWRKSAYYNEWARPWDIPWWGTASFPLKNHNCGLVFLRGSSFGPLTYDKRCARSSASARIGAG